MLQQVQAPVSVVLVYKHKENLVFPARFLWDGKVQEVKNVDLHHTCRVGGTLYHIFSVSTEGAFFKLALNTQNLFWELREILCE